MEPTNDSEERFDPRLAGALLDQSTRQARRQLDPRPPALMAALAAVILGAYVVLWLSTRDQHPYTGPSLGAVGLIYGVVAFSAAAAVTVYRRATSGIRGATKRQERIEGCALALSLTASPLIQGAMHHYHASATIVYGIVPAAGPLIVIGTTLVGIAGAKEDWPGFGLALVVVVGGMVALFVGPSGAWLAAGTGIFVATVGFAVAHAMLRAGRAAAWATTPSIR